MDEQEQPYEWGGYLNGFTVTPYKDADGNNISRSTTYDDWAYANLIDRENEEKARILLQSLQFNNNIRNAQSRFGQKYVMPTLLAAGTGGTGFISGLLGWGGAELTNKVVDSASGGKYNTWGLMMSDFTGTESTLGRTLWEMSNPGGLLGGSVGTSATNLAGSTIGHINQTSATMGRMAPSLTEDIATRAKGTYDGLKYGLLDRLLGLKIYRSFKDPSKIHDVDPYSTDNNGILSLYWKDSDNFMSTHQSTDLLDKSPEGVTINNVGLDNSTRMLKDNATGDYTFIGPYSYARNEWLFPKSSDARAFRMGFTTNQTGTKLSKVLSGADQDFITNAPEGSFISADAHGLTLPETLELTKNQGASTMDMVKRFIKGNITEEEKYAALKAKLGEDTPELNEWGMSPDAYRFFTKQGLNTGKETVYAGNTGLFNNRSANASNKAVYNWQTQYLKGNITAGEYVRRLNEWAAEFNGRPAHVDPITGKPVIYHPTVYSKLGNINNLTGDRSFKYIMGTK